MKKIAILGIVVVLLLMLIATPVMAAKGPKPAIWHVPGDFATIQEAVDAASPDDTILVGPGFHAGATVTKAVEIKGKDGAVINSGPQLWPEAPSPINAFMAGFSFPVGGGVTISHLRFEMVEFPVFSRGVDDVTVEHCTFMNSIQAVTNWHGSDWTISHNTIEDLSTYSGGGIGILVGCCLGGVSNGNLISHNKIIGTLHVAANDCGDYNGTGIVLYADFRWGYPGADEIALNRVVKNTVSLVSDTPDVVDVAAIELTDSRNDEEAAPYPVIFDNAIGFNDLRGTELQIALTPESLDDCNDISRNLGDDIPNRSRGHGLHPSVFGPGGN